MREIHLGSMCQWPLAWGEGATVCELHKIDVMRDSKVFKASKLSKSILHNLHRLCRCKVSDFLNVMRQQSLVNESSQHHALPRSRSHKHSEAYLVLCISLKDDAYINGSLPNLSPKVLSTMANIALWNALYKIQIQSWAFVTTSSKLSGKN